MTKTKKARTTQKRLEAKRDIPAGYNAIIREELNIAIYYSEEHLHVLFYQNRQTKPRLNSKYMTVEILRKVLNHYLKKVEEFARAKEQDRIASLMLKKEFFATVKTGDILCGSWGLDQVKVAFYQVMTIKGSTVTLKELNQQETDRGMLPIKGSFRNEKVIKRVVKSLYIKIDEKITVKKWDGSPQY